jgi:hypothetical protein
MYLNGEDMGEYLGYFQDSLDTAKSVADEIMDAARYEVPGPSPIGIYKLVLVETIEPPVEEEDDHG